MELEQPKFEIVQTTMGAVSIRNNVVNEIMHNPVGPWREANELYIEQSGFAAALAEKSDRPLVLFDVGLGAATNAVAAIRCALKLPVESRRSLHIVSFENDFSLLEFTLEHTSAFSYYSGLETAMRAVLVGDVWVSDCKTIIWESRPGSFLDRVVEEELSPELIFFDPYSPAVNTEMWTVACFKKLFDICSPDIPARLYTYSQATPIRAALLLAGFFVGQGQGTGLKKETTEASTHREALKNPLAERWFGRWTRSHMKYPLEATEQDFVELHARITNHPQFRGPV